MLVDDSKEVGVLSESVFVVRMETVDVLLRTLEDEREKTGGQGGKVMDVEVRGPAPVEDDRVGEGVRVMLKLDHGGRVLRLLVGILHVTLEGNSKVMDDGMSGIDMDLEG